MCHGLGLIMSNAFGTSLDLEETSTLTSFQRQKKEKKMGEGCETATFRCETVSIRDALKPHLENIPPLKSSKP